MNPTVQLFRGLMLAALSMALVSLIVTFAFPQLVPEALRVADEQIPDDVSMFSLVAQLVLFVAYVLAAIVAFVGLYTFKPWAPLTNLVLSAGTLFIWPVLGHNLSSGWAQGFSDIGGMLWGAVLAIAFLTPLREKFGRHDS